MRNVLKIVLFFVVSFAAGCVITAFIYNGTYRSLLAQLHSMDIVAHAMRAESLKAGDVDIVLQTTEKGLVDSIRIMNENKELRNASTADLALKVAKQFYYCTRTEIPSEIQSILDSVPPVEESDCRLPD